MHRRFGIGVLLVIALVAMATQAPAQLCGMSMPTVVKTTCDCCATMKSCLLPQKNPAQPSSAAQQIQPTVVMIAPVLQELFAPAFTAPPRPREFSTAQPSVHSPPRLALLCSFLI